MKNDSLQNTVSLHHLFHHFTAYTVQHLWAQNQRHCPAAAVTHRVASDNMQLIRFVLAAGMHK